MQNNLTLGRVPAPPPSMQSHDFHNTGKKPSITNLSNISGYGGVNNKSLKEVVKLVIQLMVEDIWSNFDNYSLQKRVVQQSQELKNKNNRMRFSQ